MLEIIFSALLVFCLGSLENGWPNKKAYSCPLYCAVHHKHLAFNDTVVVSLNMADNGNTNTLGGFFDLVADKQGTEIDALPSGERSIDNLKEMNRVAKNTALTDMDKEGMTTEFFDETKAFPTEKDKTKVAIKDALAEEATLNITKPRYNLGTAISEVNELFSSQEGRAKLSNQTQFMNRIAATESNYGADRLGDYSFSAFQIDPIKYLDIQERGKGGAAKERIDIANKFLREKLNRPNFDLLDLDLGKEEHNPYIGAVLTRIGLASQKESIPEDLEGQANYWKKHWNTESGAGTPGHFKSQVAAYENR